MPEESELFTNVYRKGFGVEVYMFCFFLLCLYVFLLVYILIKLLLLMHCSHLGQTERNLELHFLDCKYET